ncbi:hypothetical protein LWI29_016483 [Acer saccharum]|uniref:Uncharacterized protein n=1 Tax=Acer saccharum TaxID=4024 RepID=A0AA39T399_ACESA|nr:hypothetical protein LWI29_016483 [Acer saccharum]
MIPSSGDSFDNNTRVHGSDFSPAAMNDNSGSNGNSASTVQPVASHYMDEDNGSTENSAPTIQPVVSHHPMITRSKHGIYKPRVYLSECSLPSAFVTESEPNLRGNVRDESQLPTSNDPQSPTSAHLVINCSDRPTKGAIYQAGLALCTADSILNQRCARAKLATKLVRESYDVAVCYKLVRDSFCVTIDCNYSQVDNRDSSEPNVTPEQTVKMCDRNFGFGADGVIFSMPGINDTYNTMRIFNSDGNEPEEQLVKELEHALALEIMDKALENFGNDFEQLVKELEHGNMLCLLKSWIRLRDMNVPVNSLHSKSYISIQCEPCTRPRLRSVGRGLH